MPLSSHSRSLLSAEAAVQILAGAVSAEGGPRGETQLPPAEMAQAAWFTCPETNTQAEQTGGKDRAVSVHAPPRMPLPARTHTQGACPHPLDEHGKTCDATVQRWVWAASLHESC